MKSKLIQITPESIAISPKGVIPLLRDIQSYQKRGIPLTLIAGDYNPNKLQSSPRQPSLSSKLLEQPLLNGKRQTLSEWTNYANQEKIIFGAFHNYIKAPNQNNHNLMQNIQKMLKSENNTQIYLRK